MNPFSDDKKIKLVCFLLLFVIGESFSQVNFFVESNANYLIIPDLQKTEESDLEYNPLLGVYSLSPKITFRETYSSNIGGNVLFGIRKELLNRFSVETGIGFTFLNYERNNKVFMDFFNNDDNPLSSGNPTSYYYGYSTEDSWQVDGDTSINNYYPGDIRFNPDSITTNNFAITGNPKEEGETQLFYLNIPVSLNYEIFKNRLLVGCGGSFSVLVFSKREKIYQSFINDPTILIQDYYTIIDRWLPTESNTDIPRSTDFYSENSLKTEKKMDTSSDGISNVSLGGHIQVQARIIKQIWMIGSYHHSFTPIYDSKEQVAGNAKARFFQLGLKYYLN